VILVPILSCVHRLAIADTASTQSGTVATASPSDQLLEIVVTAEKRESTVQATPISITAISGADLQARGITDLVTVAEQTPGMSFRTAGPGQTEFEMRGISSTGGSVGTVGFYVDETPITPPSFGAVGKVVIDPSLFDLKSVEILRGPQGTLYGAGSMGGTIKVVTNQPDSSQFDASAQLTGSGTDGGGFNRSGNLMLNLPIVKDVAALRLVASSDYRDGWIDRIVVNPFPYPSNVGCPPSFFVGCVRGNVAAGPITRVIPKVNWDRVNSVRPTLLVAPSDDLNITISALYQQMNLGGYDNIDVPPGCEAGVLCGHYQPFDVPEPFSDRVKLLSGVVKYTGLGVVELTSATSYWSRNEQQTQDATEAIQNALGTPFVPVPYTEIDESAQFSQELRATSRGTGRFQWLAGLFFSNFHYRLVQNSANSFFADPVLNPQGVLYDINVPYDTKEYAVFAEASYMITPFWKLTAGVREFRYRSEDEWVESGVFAPYGAGTLFTQASGNSDHGTNPKFNLAYIPSGDLTVYATASKGFRPGGISEPLPLTGTVSCLPSLKAVGFTGTAQTYGPDSLWNFELGVKARSDEGRVSIHGDVFYIRWNDIQQVIPLSCGYLLEANAGNARSYGPEVEIQAKLTPALTVGVNAAYTKSYINQPAAFAGVPPGQPLFNISKYTANAFLEYQHPVSSQWTLTSRVTESITGPQWDIAYAMQQLPSYALTDLRVSLGRNDGKWTATAFVQNATNKMAILTVNNTLFTENIPDLTRATVNQPRTIGIQMDWHYR